MLFTSKLNLNLIVNCKMLLTLDLILIVICYLHISSTPQLNCKMLFTPDLNLIVMLFMLCYLHLI